MWAGLLGVRVCVGKRWTYDCVRPYVSFISDRIFTTADILVLYCLKLFRVERFGKIQRTFIVDCLPLLKHDWTCIAARYEENENEEAEEEAQRETREKKTPKSYISWTVVAAHTMHWTETYFGIDSKTIDREFYCTFSVVDLSVSLSGAFLGSIDILVSNSCG